MGERHCACVEVFCVLASAATKVAHLAPHAASVRALLVSGDELWSGATDGTLRRHRLRAEGAVGVGALGSPEHLAV